MVRCFSVRTVLPLLERPFPGPRPRPLEDGGDGEKDVLCPVVPPVSSSLSCPTKIYTMHVQVLKDYYI